MDSISKHEENKGHFQKLNNTMTKLDVISTLQLFILEYRFKDRDIDKMNKIINYIR